MHSIKRTHTFPDTCVRGAGGERERATLRAGLCSEETGRISCSAKRETLPKGLPPIDPALLPPFSLLDRFSCRSSAFLPFFFPIILYIYTMRKEKPMDEKRMCVIYSFFLMLPFPPPDFLSSLLAIVRAGNQ